MNPLISIITPVYNTEKLLEKCIKSIIKQTFFNYELILVNDGSTDKSGEICNMYEKQDSRIIVIHQHNQGSSAARNKGLSLARGKYIVFVDSDDWLEPYYLQNMLDCALNNNADIVISAFYINDDSHDSQFFKNKPETIDRTTILNGFFTNKLHAGLWNKMIKRDIFTNNNISFPKYNYYEDMVVSTLLIIASPSITYCERASYHYVINNSSLTNDKNDFKRFKMFQDFIYNINFIRNLPFIESNMELLNSIDGLINYNKKGIVKISSNKQIINKTMNLNPDSIKFLNIKTISDFFLFISSKTHIYKPLKYYLYIRSHT